jgi:hypothetical protein
VITLPAITLGTALFVLNLEHLLNIWNSITVHCAIWLRLRMRQHRRKDWKNRAIALQEDIAVARAPVRKAQRQSSGWVYLLFLLEYGLVGLPINEIKAALSSAGLLGKASEGCEATHQRRPSVLIENGDDNVDSPTAQRQRRKEEIKQRINQSLEDEKRQEEKRKCEERGNFVTALLRSREFAVKALKKFFRVSFSTLRVILIPFWIVMLAIEYIALIILLALHTTTRSLLSTGSPPASSEPAPKSLWIQGWEILGLDVLLPFGKPPVEPEYGDTDFSTRAVTRVATRLGGIASLRNSPSMNKSPLSPHLVNTKSPSHFRRVDRTDTNPRAQHAKDILRVPTSSPAARRVRRARMFARSGLNPQLELDDMEKVLPSTVSHY